MDDDDIATTVEMPAITDDGETEDGPACGSPQAATYFLATYNDASGMHFIERHCCCFRHVPRPDVLPEGAELVEIVIQDAWNTTVVRDGLAHVTPFGSDESIVTPAQLLS